MILDLEEKTDVCVHFKIQLPKQLITKRRKKLNNLTCHFHKVKTIYSSVVGHNSVLVICFEIYETE